MRVFKLKVERPRGDALRLRTCSATEWRQSFKNKNPHKHRAAFFTTNHKNHHHKAVTATALKNMKQALLLLCFAHLGTAMVPPFMAKCGGSSSQSCYDDQECCPDSDGGGYMVLASCALYSLLYREKRTLLTLLQSRQSDLRAFLAHYTYVMISNF